MEVDQEQKRKIRVLICHENEVIRIYLRDIFWVNGFESCCEILDAPDLDEAERIANSAETRPDIIFLGTQLKKSIEGRTSIDPANSFAFAHRLRTDPAFGHIQILIFSTKAAKQLEEDINNADVDKYIYNEQTLPADLVVTITGLIKEAQGVVA